jgi:hypothetical protein
VLLVHLADAKLRLQGAAVQAGNQAETDIVRRALGAAVLGQRQGTSIDQQVPKEGVVADDFRHYRHRQIGLFAGSNLGLEHVAEHVDARAHLGDALQVPRMQGGRS